MGSILMLPSFLDKGIHYPDLLRSSGSLAPPGKSRNLLWGEAHGLYWPDLGSIWQMVYVSQVTGQPAHGTANGGRVCPFQRRGLHGHKVLLLDPLRCGFNDVFCQGHHVHLEPGGHRALRLGWGPRSQPGLPPTPYLGKRNEGGWAYMSVQCPLKLPKGFTWFTHICWDPRSEDLQKSARSNTLNLREYLAYAYFLLSARINWLRILRPGQF